MECLYQQETRGISRKHFPEMPFWIWHQVQPRTPTSSSMPCSRRFLFLSYKVPYLDNENLTQLIMAGTRARRKEGVNRKQVKIKTF